MHSHLSSVRFDGYLSSLFVSAIEQDVCKGLHPRDIIRLSIISVGFDFGVQFYQSHKRMLHDSKLQANWRALILLKEF